MAVSTSHTYTFTGSGAITGLTGLSMSGTGTLILANTGGNSYSGGTTINSGTIQLGAANALPGGASVSIAGGGVLDLGGNSPSIGTLTGTGTIANSNTTTVGTLVYAGSGSATFGGVIQNNVPAGSGSAGTAFTISSGSLTLTGANTYTGATTVSFGSTLQIGVGGSAGSLSPSTAVNDSGNLIYDLNTSPTFSGNIAGGGTFTQNGSGTITLTGTNTYGTTIINSGGIQVGIGGAAGTLGVGGLVDNGLLTMDVSTNVSIAGVITGTGAITQAGSGTLTLTTNSTFSGGVTVANGTVIANGSGGSTSLGLGNTTIDAAGTLIGAAADSLGYNGGDTSPGQLNIVGGTVTDLGTASYRITLPNLVFTGGTITNVATNLGDTNGEYSLQGPQNGAISSGPASIVTNSASTTAVFSATTVSIENPLTITTAPGNVTTGPTPGVDLLISSVLKNYNTNVELVTKAGLGVLELTGANTYTGGTALNQGTLIVANTTGSATGTGNVTLNGGTLASGLVGSISGNLLAGTGPHTIAPGGIGTVGALAIGGLTSSGTPASLTTLNFDLGTGSSVVTNGDLLTLGSGTVSIASGTALTFGGSPAAGKDYRLIGGTLTGITLGNFALPAAPGGLAYSLSTAVDPGFIDLVVVTSGPASLTWDDAGGTGDGIHWDTANQNWNNGSAPALYSDGALVTFNDANNFGNGVGQNSTAYNVTLNAMVQPGSVTVNNSSGNYTISGTGAINGSTGLTKTGTSSLTLATANGYTGPTAINQGTLSLTPSGSIASSPITIGTSGVGATAGALSLAAGSSGFLVRNLASLNIVNGSATVATAATTATRSVVVTSALTISANGKLDLSNNDMVVHNGSQSGITSLIASGYHGGPWNGASGITSSTAAAGSNTALGVELNSNGSGGTLIGTFDGQTVTSTDVLVKYTYFGDANLDGVVNGSDYTLIDNGFNNNLTGWHNGDFNYDGIVNGDDYTLIDNAFNTQGASLAGLDAAPSEMVAINTSQIDGGSSGGTAVPEPTSLGLLAIGAVGLLGRRRRRVGK